MVLIQKRTYLDAGKVVVDQDEYTETVRNIRKIAGEAVGYLEGYIQHINGNKVLHPKEYARKYQYSTLPYFHDIMNL